MTDNTTIVESIRTVLLRNSLQTAEAYTLYDKSDEIQKAYPSRESFNRFVRRIKARVLETQEQAGPAGKAVFTEDVDGATIEVFDSDRIKTLEQLIAECSVDLKTWRVDSYTVNRWEQSSVEKGIVPLFQIKARLVRIAPSIPVIQPLQFYSIPPVEPQVPTDGVKKVLVFADAQIGFNHRGDKWEAFHSREAMDIILKILQDHTFDEIIIDGDMLDMTEASRYTQKPEFAGTLQPAINELGLFLYQIRRLAPASKIVYLSGNHCIRLQNSMIENFRFAYNLKAYNQELPLLSIRNILQLDQLGIEYIEDYPKGTYWIGNDLRIIHGEYTSSVKELNTSNTSVIMGHLHRCTTDSKTTSYKDGPRQVSVHVLGCLCKIDGTVPGVNTRPNWQQGFAVVEQAGDITSFNHVQIYNGKCLYGGKVYQGIDPRPNQL